MIAHGRVTDGPDITIQRATVYKHLGMWYCRDEDDDTTYIVVGETSYTFTHERVLLGIFRKALTLTRYS
jgi:hypothetical protein